MTTEPNDDRVEREILVRAPIARVYAALTDPALFPTWGPLRIEGTLTPGERAVFDFGPAGGGKAAVHVVAVEPPRYFAYRWAQGATDPAILLGDPLQVPNTLVEFRLDEVGDQVRVRVIESGISQLPSVPGIDRKTALDHMGRGWELMIGGVARYFAAPALASTDRVEHELVVPASRERAHAALLAPTGWWAEQMEGAMAPGELTLLDFGQYGKWRIAVTTVEPPGYLAYRRVQSDDPARLTDDPRTSPSTLVELRLEDAPGGAKVRVVESGFDALPGDRAALQRLAQQAWGIILGLLGQHLEHHREG